MKKTERILGIAAISLFIAGVFMKSQHWPASGVSIGLSLILFNFGYLPVNLIFQWRQATSALQKSYVITKFIIFFIVMTGFLFKVQHWPGAGIMLASSKVLLPLIILFYFYLRIRKKGALPFDLNDFIVAIIAYAVHIYLSSTLVPPSVMEGYVFIEDKHLKMNAGIESANNMIYNSLDSTRHIKDEELLQSIRDLRAQGEQFRVYSDSLKKQFYFLCAGSFHTDNLYQRRLPYTILANISYGPEYFIIHGNGDELKNRINGFKAGVTQIAGRHNLQSGLIGMGLGTEEVRNKWGDEIPWVSYMFEFLPVGAVFTNLSWIKQMALLTESTLLNGLVSQLDLSEETKLLQELASRESGQAMKLKENEILRIRQQQELQKVQLKTSQTELKQRNTVTLFAFLGIAFVLILLFISTRAYVLKQKDNKRLTEQKDEISEMNEELNQQNEEIAAQRDEIEAQRDMVYKQKDQIERTHNEISASIDYASRLQSSILPNMDLLKEQCSDHFILFRPRDKVSGDFYWWTRVEDQIVIAVADCTGHGVPGAFMSMLGISLMSEIVNKEFITHPGVILRRMRKEVIRALRQTGEIGEQQDGMDIAIVSINTESRHCHYAGANNPLYLIKEGELKEFRPDRMPISIYQRMDNFTTHEIRLDPGDQLYLFSDGYADQFGGPNRKKFKYAAFKQLLLDHSGDSMELQNKALLHNILKWQGNYEQIDDMVVIGVKV